MIQIISEPRKDSGYYKHVTVRCSYCNGTKEMYLSAALKAKSCGCLPKTTTKHGYSDTPIYHVWESIKSRCLNPTNPHYKNYGGRGIKVCGGWKDFETFLAWSIVSGYRKGLWIDRKDVNGNYQPSNCHWVTPAESNQNRRKSPNRLSQYLGVTRDRGKWVASAQLNGARKHLGRFEKELDAAKTRDKFVNKHYSNPRLNPI